MRAEHELASALLAAGEFQWESFRPRLNAALVHAIGFLPLFATRRACPNDSSPRLLLDADGVLRSPMLLNALRKLWVVVICAALAPCACSKEHAEGPSSAGSGAPGANAPVAASGQAPQPLDAELLRDRLGVAVSVVAGGAMRATLPRGDLNLAVTVDAAPLPKALALGTSVELRPAPEGAALSGSVALFEDEVSPAFDTLLAHGIQVVGLHNRFSFDEPRVLIMHFAGKGNAALLASGVQSLGAAIRDARLRSPAPLRSSPGDEPTAGTLDAKAIGGALGLAAREQAGEVLVVLPSPEGSQTPAAVAGEPLLRAVWQGSDAHAALDGSFVLTSAELAPVLGALRRANLHISAVHAYAAEQAPNHFLVYFRGKGSSLDLVRALLLALEARVTPR